MPLGKDTCFARVYYDAHLKAHPKQRVTSFHLVRDFSPDAMREEITLTDRKGKLSALFGARFGTDDRVFRLLEQFTD
jgi:hypothetical protein